MNKSDTDELAALRPRIEQLERAAKPPEPFKPDDWRPPNPIDRLSMDPSVMHEMAQAIPTDMVRGIIRDNQAPTGPSSAGAIPSSQQVSNVRGTGWSREIPLSNPPGVAQA